MTEEVLSPAPGEHEQTQEPEDSSTPPTVQHPSEEYISGVILFDAQPVRKSAD